MTATNRIHCRSIANIATETKLASKPARRVSPLTVDVPPCPRTATGVWVADSRGERAGHWIETLSRPACDGAADVALPVVSWSRVSVWRDANSDSRFVSNCVNADDPKRLYPYRYWRDLQNPLNCGGGICLCGRGRGPRRPATADTRRRGARAKPNRSRSPLTGATGAAEPRPTTGSGVRRELATVASQNFPK